MACTDIENLNAILLSFGPNANRTWHEKRGHNTKLAADPDLSRLASEEAIEKSLI
jgi:hypothetical protein